MTALPTHVYALNADDCKAAHLPSPPRRTCWTRRHAPRGSTDSEAWESMGVVSLQYPCSHDHAQFPNEALLCTPTQIFSSARPTYSDLTLLKKLPHEGVFAGAHSGMRTKRSLRKRVQWAFGHVTSWLGGSLASRRGNTVSNGLSKGKAAFTLEPSGQVGSMADDIPSLV